MMPLCVTNFNFLPEVVESSTKRNERQDVGAPDDVVPNSSAVKKHFRQHAAGVYHTRIHRKCLPYPGLVGELAFDVGIAHICVDYVDGTNTVSRTCLGDGGDFIAGSRDDTFLGDMDLEVSGTDEAAVFFRASIRKRRKTNSEARGKSEYAKHPLPRGGT